VIIIFIIIIKHAHPRAKHCEISEIDVV